MGQRENRVIHLVLNAETKSDLGQYLEALAILEEAEALLGASTFAELVGHTLLRSKLWISKGRIHHSHDRISKALESFGTAKAILSRPHLAIRREFDADRAMLAFETGSCLFEADRPTEALAELRRAQTILEGPFVVVRPRLDSFHAKLAMNIGMCLEALGRLSEALQSFQRADAVLAQPHLCDRPEHESTRAQVAMNAGNCLDLLGRPVDALDSYSRAALILERPQLANRPELDKIRAALALNYGICLRSLGRIDGALERYRFAEVVLARPHLAGRKLDRTRATLAMNIGSSLADLGQPSVALEMYIAAVAILDRPHLAGRSEFDLQRAELLMGIGACLCFLNRPKEALERFGSADAILKLPHLSVRRELDLRRAELAINTGVCLDSLGLRKEALASYLSALRLLEGPELVMRPELHNTRAKLAVNTGSHFAALSRPSEALESYRTAERFWNTSEDLALPEQVDLAKTFWLVSFLLPEMGASAQSWALSSSDRLVEILDLDPRGDIAPWPELRGHFASFHVNWLRHCLAGGPEDRAMVPRVLNALQGRKLTAEMIEAALASEGAHPAIRDYAKLKGELRDLLRHIEAAEGRGQGAFDLGGGPGGADGGGVRGFEGFGGGVSGGGFERRRDEGLLERLRAEFRDKERALAATREKVAQLPGFEVLGKPLGMMSLEAVREKLAPGEALVLALPLERDAGPGASGVAVPLDGPKSPAGFETRLWVLRAEGDPEVIALPEALTAGTEDAAWDASLQGLGAAFAAFNAGQSGRGGMRRGGWGAEVESGEAAEIADDGVATEVAAELLDGSDDVGASLRGEAALTLPPGVTEAEAFWPRMADAMDRLFWAPLRASGVLEGVETLLLATTGPLHNLPFGAGRREDDPELWQVNSLVTWALGRGLYGARKEDEEAAVAPAPAVQVQRRLGVSDRSGPVGLLSNPESLDIPLAGAEVGLAARLWQVAAPQGSARAVISDTAHPWQPEEPLRLVHLACHGSIDTRPGETPRAVIGLSNRKTPDAKARVVTERHVLAGPPAGEVLMNLCVGGQAYDDLLDGDPTGLIPAWLRHGAHTVVAALPPVPDTHGALFGTTVTLLMTDPEEPLPLAEAARRAARILGEDPGLASPRIAARMAGLLPSLALPEVMAAIRRAEKGHRGGPIAGAISLELDRMLTGRRTVKGRLVARPPVLWWLDAEADRQLVDLPVNLGRVPTEAEVLSLLTTLQPDPDRDGIRAVFPDPNAFPVDAQTIRYGYAVFGDPRAQHRKA